MKNAVTKLMLDLNGRAPMPRVPLKQGDEASRQIDVTLYVNGTLYDETSPARIYTRRPDGEPFYNNITGGVTVGELSYTFTSDELAVAGRGYAEIRIMNSAETQILSSFPFELDIVPSVYSDDALLGTDNGSAFKDYVDAAKNAAQAAENAAQEAEDAAQEAAAALDGKFPVQTQDIAAGAVTEDKLADGVKEKIQNALVKKQVDELPNPDEPIVLGGRSIRYTRSGPGTNNLLETSWVDLDEAVNLTPITDTKQIRFKLTVNHLQGEKSGFYGGGIRLRNHNEDSDKVSLPMAGKTWEDGEESEVIYSLDDFTPADSVSWSRIDQIMVFVYSNGELPYGSISFNELQFIDTNAISENAIYIVPSDDPQAGDAHDEYMYIDGAWEKIGGSLADGEVTTQKLANGAVTEDKLSDGAVTVEKTDFAGRKWVFKSVEGELWANYTQESGSTSTGTISTPGGGNYLLYPNTVPQDPSRAFITLHGSSMKAVALSDLAEVSCSDTSYSHGLLLQVPPEYYEFELSIQPEHTSAAGEDTAYYTACSVEEERLLVDGLLVMEENLRDGAVTTTKLADGAVTADKLADGVLDSAGVVQTGTATLTCTSGAASEKFDCSYCKIGNMVTLRGSGYNITTTWGTGVTFTGLPFPCQGVSGFVWKSTSSAGFWGFGYLSGNSLNICKEIAYSPYEGSKTDLTGPYDGTGFTVTYITGS